MESDRDQCELHVELDELVTALDAGHDVEPNAALSHTMNGLVRAGLIGAMFGFGNRVGLGEAGTGSARNSPFPIARRRVLT